MPASYVRNTRFPELFKYPASSVWWCFIPNPNGGRQLRESTGQRDERAAHAYYLARVREPIASPDSPAHKESRTLADALDARIDWLKAARLREDPSRKKLAEATIDFYTRKGRHLTRVLGAETPVSAIGHQQIREYITARTKETASGSTISKELTCLSMAMRLARKDGIDCEIFRDIKPEGFASVYVPRTRWLTEAEVDALLDELPPERAAVVAFIIATSATYPSEVTPVTKTMVNAKTYEVLVPGTKRELRYRRLIVPSHARRFFDMAVPHIPFQPWTNIRRDLHMAAERLSTCAKCRKAGKVAPVENCKGCEKMPTFAHLSPNDLRRTFVQWLVRSGVPNELVSPMTGHKDTRMIERVYGRREATAVADLVELALAKAPRNARARTKGVSRV